MKRLVVTYFFAILAQIFSYSFAQDSPCVSASFKGGKVTLRKICDHKAGMIEISLRFSSNQGNGTYEPKIYHEDFDSNGYLTLDESFDPSTKFFPLRQKYSPMNNKSADRISDETLPPPANANDEVWMAYYRKTGVLNGKTTIMERYGKCKIAIVKLMKAEHCFMGIEEKNLPVDNNRKVVYMTQSYYDNRKNGKVTRNINKGINDAINRSLKQNQQNNSTKF